MPEQFIGRHSPHSQYFTKVIVDHISIILLLDYQVALLIKLFFSALEEVRNTGVFI